MGSFPSQSRKCKSNSGTITLWLYILAIQYNCDCHTDVGIDEHRWVQGVALPQEGRSHKLISSPFKKFKGRPWIHFVQRTMSIQQSGHRKGMTGDDEGTWKTWSCQPFLCSVSLTTRWQICQFWPSQITPKSRQPSINFDRQLFYWCIRINTNCIKDTNPVLSVNERFGESSYRLNVVSSPYPIYNRINNNIWIV